MPFKTIDYLNNCSQFAIRIHGYCTADIIQTIQEELTIVRIPIGNMNWRAGGGGTSGGSKFIVFAALYRFAIV